MRGRMLVVGLLLAAGPVLAQQFPAAPLRSPGEQMRVMLLKNESGQVVTSAQAHMTDGQNRVLTYAPVQPYQARELVVPRKECIDSITVQLNNGRTLRADHMNDCKATQIVVWEAGGRPRLRLALQVRQPEWRRQTRQAWRARPARLTHCQFQHSRNQQLAG